VESRVILGVAAIIIGDQRAAEYGLAGTFRELSNSYLYNIGDGTVLALLELL